MVSPVEQQVFSQNEGCTILFLSLICKIFKGSDVCDESIWPDIKLGDEVCGDCKILVDDMNTKYGTSAAYCQAVGRRCEPAWEEDGNSCRIKSTEDRSHNFGVYTSDAICECGDILSGIIITIYD